MDDIKDICVEEGITVSESMSKLDSAGEKVLLVTKGGKLTGIITDGDIRRWVLKKGSFGADVNEMMNKNPKTVLKDEVGKAKEMMLDMRLEAIPIVDENNIPVDIVFLREVAQAPTATYKKVNIPVVIMAGGKGTRLYPYTNVLPKPLIPIGSTTIIERIIESFCKNGCDEFWITLNYKKNLIKAYLDDREENKYKVNYIEEKDFFGTCGSIGLLKDKISGPFFVSNCDVLADIDYAELFHFHKMCGNELTVVTSLKHMEMPYGIIELDEGGVVNNIMEKPSYDCNVNTGIYVMEESLIESIPPNQIYHMTDLINMLLRQQRKVGAYPIMEQRWKDMGEVNEMYKMITDFQE